MSIPQIVAAIALVGFPSTVRSSAEPAYAAKYEKLTPPAAVAESIGKLLAADALVVRGEQGETVMEVWFRDPMPVMATAEQFKNGLTYREIPEGTLVGAIHFPQPFTDYRRQVIPTGDYILRFAVQPDIGDHTGTAPHPDFCLMTPASKDGSFERIEKKQLIQLSSEVNEGKHPAVLLLFPSFAKEEAPKISSKGDGVWIVSTPRRVMTGEQAGTLGFGITVAGTWKP